MYDFGLAGPRPPPGRPTPSDPAQRLRQEARDARRSAGSEHAYIIRRQVAARRSGNDHHLVLNVSQRPGNPCSSAIRLESTVNEQADSHDDMLVAAPAPERITGIGGLALPAVKTGAEITETLLLRWSPRGEQSHYRVVVTADEETVHVSAAVNRPWVELMPDVFESRERLYWRAQWRAAGESSWSDLSPSFRLFAPRDRGPTTRLRWKQTGARAYRVLIRDDSDREYVVKDVVDTPSYPVTWSELDGSHRHHWRAEALAHDGTWENLTELRPLLAPPSVRVGEQRARERVVPDDPEKLLFLYTVDTEAGLRRMRTPSVKRAVDELIFGEFGDGERNGIDLQMDLLESFGMRCCFFVDILMESQFGDGALAPVVERILERGHEVQLHLHPTHIAHSGDPALSRLGRALVEDDPDLFRRALEIAVKRFTERVGEPPLAFRAGSYHLCDAFLAVLPEFGIRIDSSLNPRKNCRTSEWMRSRTQPFWVGDLLEVPVSYMLLRGEADQALRMRQLAPARAGRQAAFAGIPTAGRASPATLTYVSHSYQMLEVHREVGSDVSARWHEELLGRNPACWEYRVSTAEERFSFFGPRVDQSRVAGLLELLEQLSSRGDVVGTTFAELDAIARAHFHGSVAPINDPIPVWDERARAVDLTAGRTLTASQLRLLETDRDRQAPVAGAGADATEPAFSEIIDELDLGDARVGLWCDGDAVQLTEQLQRGGIAHLWTADSLRPQDCAPPPEPFDVVVMRGMLHRTLGEDLVAALSWWRVHCRPGARVVVVSPTVFGEHGAGLAPPLSTPHAHLLFGIAAVEIVAGAGRPVHAVNPYCAATYARLLNRAGFALERLSRVSAGERAARMRAANPGKFAWYDAEECETGAFVAMLSAADAHVSPGSDRERDPIAFGEVLDRLRPVLDGAGVLIVGEHPERLRKALAKRAEPARIELDADDHHGNAFDLIALQEPAESAQVARFRRLFDRVRPGGQLIALVTFNGSPLSASPMTATSYLAAFAIAGWELADVDHTDGALSARLLRPLEPSDIAALPEVFDVRAEQEQLRVRRERMMRERERTREPSADTVGGG